MINLKRSPKLIEAFVPVIFLIGLLLMNVIFFDDTLEGANQIALLLAASVAVIIANYLGVDWKNVRNGIVRSIGSAI